MKVRKLAVALALAGGLGSGVAQALGLGEIELQSYLNQPLNAEIDVNRVGGVSPGDIIVNLASEQDYERVGLPRDYFLTRLNFNVTTAPSGELIISVTTREPVREPYLNFLVEVTWPSGRVMREYSVLVDPPVYAEDSGVSEPVQPSQSRQASSQPTSTSGSQSRSAPATTSATSSGYSGGSTLGPIQASDTLWDIAQRVRPDSSVSMNQVMLAIQDLNPDAFINGNINRIKRGEVLRVPDMGDIRARTKAQANSEVAAQNQAFSQPAPQVDATDSNVTESGSGEGAAGSSSDELRLVVPEDEDASSEGSAGGDGRQGGTADAGEAVALEELDRVQRENDDLNSRVEDLQDQVETLQRLIELKDSQLAEIQGNMADDGEASDSGEGAGDTAGEFADDGAMESAESGDDESMDSSTMGEQSPASGEPATPGLDGTGAAESEGVSDPTATSDLNSMPADDMAASDEPVKEPQSQPEQQEPVAEAPSPVTEDEPQAEQPQPAPTAQDKGFLATAIDLIAGNFMYQIALGGFLVLLLLVVLLISRRRADKDDEFYQDLDDDDGDDGFELTLGEEEAAASANALEEADRYVSYGQHDAAAEVLENAISREPSRSDLRLKLLAVYADTGNRAAFDKQYAELEAMELDDAQPEAEALRTRLEDVESTPSIDELESQLRDDSFGESQQEDPDQTSTDIASTSMDDETSELMASFEELDRQEDSTSELEEDNKDDAIEYDFTGFDTSDPDEQGADNAKAEATEEELGDGLDAIDFELPDDQSGELEASEEPGSEEKSSPDLEDDFASLELDDAGIDSETAAENVEGASEPAEDDLDFGDLELDAESTEPVDHSSNPADEADMDESFLDELDAELDKVTSDDEADDGLEDLELDVSDEDLELMDQASGAEPEDESQLDLGDLDDLDLDETGSPDATLEDDDLSDLEIPELESDSVAGGEQPTETDSAEARPEESASIDEIDEASLGDDDDFDFLSGTDEVATKLDLARAYVDMGDSEGAREILEEVILEGNDDQKADAQSLLKKLP